MAIIEWKKQYEIGHARIDSEHQIFVDLIAKINDAVKENKDQEYLQRLLYELRKYTEFHFVSEENIMYSINYPEYEIHKQHHDEVLEKYSQKIMEVELGEQTIEDFLAFLLDWFVNHTLSEDIRIANYIKGKNI